MTKEAKLTESSGNVFRDLGLENADELFIKAELISCIREALEQKGLSQTQAARLLKLPQPKLSQLLNGKMDSITIDRLLRYLMRLNFNIQITLEETSATPSIRVA
jgi:predicted XRE-type DNA-binding protein